MCVVCIWTWQVKWNRSLLFIPWDISVAFVKLCVWEFFEYYQLPQSKMDITSVSEKWNHFIALFLLASRGRLMWLQKHFSLYRNLCKSSTLIPFSVTLGNMDFWVQLLDLVNSCSFSAIFSSLVPLSCICMSSLCLCRFPQGAHAITNMFTYFTYHCVLHEGIGLHSLHSGFLLHHNV